MVTFVRIWVFADFCGTARALVGGKSREIAWSEAPELIGTLRRNARRWPWLAGPYRSSRAVLARAAHWRDRDLAGHYVTVYEDLMDDPRRVTRQPKLALDLPARRFRAIALPDCIHQARRCLAAKLPEAVKRRVRSLLDGKRSGGGTRGKTQIAGSPGRE